MLSVYFYSNLGATLTVAIVMREFQKEALPGQRLHRPIEIEGFELPLHRRQGLGAGQRNEPPGDGFEPKARFIIAPVPHR
jgi:hypothetical protein